MNLQTITTDVSTYRGQVTISNFHKE